MIGLPELLAGLNIAEKLGKFLNWLLGKKPAPVAETISTRFIRLFESHGVHRNQIPRFIGRGLTLKDVQDDASLLAKLDETLLEAVCAKFAVRREWLDGADAQVHPCHEFYKYPEMFAEFIERLMDENPDADLQGVLIAPEEADDRADAVLIIQETVGAIGEKAIYRFHLCDIWPLSYWKARAYVTACIAIAWKRQAFVSGVYMSKKDIEQVSGGMTLLGWQGEGIWFLGHWKWYPEDLALRPDAFLDGVDPEKNNFGIKSGLSLWLDLEQQGLMDAGLSSSKNARVLFEKELAKYDQ